MHGVRCPNICIVSSFLQSDRDVSVLIFIHSLCSFVSVVPRHMTLELLYENMAAISV